MSDSQRAFVAIDGLKDLPSMPVVVMQLNQLINDDSTSAAEIARLVELDTALVTKVLRIVNSSFYGFPRRISSIDESVSFLGFNFLRQLMLSTAVIDTLDPRNEAVNMHEFWAHSFGVGIIAKRLLGQSQSENRSLALLCGLLHDIGYLVLARTDRQLFAALYGNDDRAVDLQAEESAFGINHQQIGRILAEKWNFPENISQAIAAHHTPSQAAAEHSRLVSTIHVADIMCHAIGIGGSPCRFVTAFDPAAVSALQLDLSRLDPIIEAALREADEVMNLFLA
jgi:putative nucleotidyltransferase with HDIG domain